jgi:hypothetical protein
MSSTRRFLIAPALARLIRKERSGDRITEGGEAKAFAAPSWFGPEVTEEPAFQNRAIALEGVPRAPEVPLSNAALDSLLDALENRIRPAPGYEAAFPRERQITRPGKPPPVTNGSLGPTVTGAGDELVRELGRALRPGQ